MEVKDTRHKQQDKDIDFDPVRSIMAVDRKEYHFESTVRVISDVTHYISQCRIANYPSVQMSVYSSTFVEVYSQTCRVSRSSKFEIQASVKVEIEELVISHPNIPPESSELMNSLLCGLDIIYGLEYEGQVDNHLDGRDRINVEQKYSIVKNLLSIDFGPLPEMTQCIYLYLFQDLLQCLADTEDFSTTKQYSTVSEKLEMLQSNHPRIFTLVPLMLQDNLLDSMFTNLAGTRERKFFGNLIGEYAARRPVLSEIRQNLLRC